jgi:hypothetical protein
MLMLWSKTRGTGRKPTQKVMANNFCRVENIQQNQTLLSKLVLTAINALA